MPPFTRLDALAWMIIGGVVGGRVGHVLLNWNYFESHPGERLALDGIDWHMALVAAFFVGAFWAGRRRIDLSALLEPLMPVFLLIILIGWAGCLSGFCAYGMEVRSLADLPSFFTAETPDVFGIIAPRLNIPAMGIALTLSGGALYGGLRLLKVGRGLRVWIPLALIAFGLTGLEMFRGDVVPLWWGVRADAALSLGLALSASLCALRRATTPTRIPQQ
ncbi:MAG TPA: prolipoprotein diacylglyceryl transferase [Aggregatilineales bacterium]|nr:prolipoprotein diacylglyceryl transferase [Anaerolineales bacterium]HRE47324.1 prolipoprotein diacylglyceryl transferase [Aggregatilineales bacterium]